MDKKQVRLSRAQVFWNVTKTKWRLLVGMSMLLFTFFLPLLVGLFVVQYLKPVAIDKLIATGTADALSVFALCTSWNAIGLAAGMIGGVISSIAVAGVCHTLQLLVWQEGVVFVQDFATGVRESYKHFFSAHVLICFACFAVALNLDFVRFSGESSVVLAISTVLTTAAAALLLGSGIFAAAQSLQYRVTASGAVKNGLLLTLGYFPRNVVMLISLILPVAGVLYLGIGAIATALLIMGVMGFSLVLMALVLYCNRIFDISINAEAAVENVDRGLMVPLEDV